MIDIDASAAPPPAPAASGGNPGLIGAGAAQSPSILQSILGLAKLPLSLANAYGAALGAVPQRVQDDMTMRNINLQNAMAMRGLIPGILGTDPNGAQAPRPAPPSTPPSPPSGDVGAGPPMMQAPGPSMSGPGPTQGGIFGQAPGMMSRQQRALAAMSLMKGDASGAWTIMHPDLMQAADGSLVDKNSGTVVGRLPKPEAVNNTIVDLGAPANTNRVIPSAPVPGAMPIYDNLGQVKDWSLPAGAQGAIAADAAAKANPAEAAKANYDLVDVPQSDGSTIKMPRAAALALLGGGGATGAPSQTLLAPSAAGGLPTAPGVTPLTTPRLGVSQSPSAAKLNDARAANQGKLEADMHGANAAMQQVDDQTNMVRQNLHDMLGETQDPRTGQWVKTKPSMINGMSTGSATDLIEHVPIVGQSARDLAAKVETVRNGTSFNALQAIKNAMQASGDGGGASIRMTDQTARMLGEINGSLDQDQSSPQFEATVRRHLSQLDTLDKARHDLFASQYANIQTPAPGNTGPQATNYAPRGSTPAPSRTDVAAELRRRGLLK